MSSPAPADAPESDVGITILPPILQAPSPENDDFTPPPAPAITLPISVIPSLPPLVAPTLPIVVGDTPPPTSIPPPLPTPTLTPISQSPPLQPQPQPQPQPPPQPQLQPQPQPPLTTPTPTRKNIPPAKKTSPLKNISPPLSKPINTKPQPQPQPPTSSITNDPILPTSPRSPPTSPEQPKTRPIIHPNPSQPTPTRPKTTPPTATPRQSSPLPTSAILPASPPVALPVPQSPSGGAWIPFSTESPTPLPILPGPPKTLSSPAGPLHGNTIPSSSVSSDHPNIASAVAPKGSSNSASGFVVGLAVGGILLLLLGTVFGILCVFCKRRDKKKVGDNESGSKVTTLYNEFEEKGSLPQFQKQVSNNTLGHHTKINNVSTPKGPNMAKGTPQVNVGPTLGSVTSFSSGSFTYEELSRATDGFSEHNLLGQGGFGYVHKGVLANGKEVAVKQLKMGGDQGEREFRAEVETISQVHHKHLVSLVGYCIAGAERLLVYEFVPNNTLEFHLHGKGKPVMDWPTRLKIAIGSAKGFAYLHEDCSPTIIHRDIKAANILLDFNFEAKVSDFGLAKIFSSTNPSAIHITTRVVGTFGYLAPEYASSGKVTDKSDVYSYGVMLLELITGHPPISNFESSTSGSLVNWARPLLAQAIGDGNFDALVDPKLQNNYNVDEMTSMVACAAACVRLSAWRRPRMSQVVRALEGNLSPSELDDGTRPGQSAMHFPYESLDFDAKNYMEDLKRMVLTGNNGHTTTNRYSENTSEYGLNLSVSSTDTSHLSNSRG